MRYRTNWIGEGPLLNIPLGAFEDLRALNASDLEGVEYYSIESAPAQYGINSGACAVVLLWTKF